MVIKTVVIFGEFPLHFSIFYTLFGSLTPSSKRFLSLSHARSKNSRLSFYKEKGGGGTRSSGKPSRSALSIFIALLRFVVITYIKFWISVRNFESINICQLRCMRKTIKCQAFKFSQNKSLEARSHF